METQDQTLLSFLAHQVETFGGKVEADDGLWTLMAVPVEDIAGNDFARLVLDRAPFPHDAGPTADDRWTLYYVATAHRAEAMLWLEDTAKTMAGEIRPVSATLAPRIAELITSPKPHRVAQQLADLHLAGEITAGLIRDPAVVRSLLDRMHQCEPLYFSALLVLLKQHLVDLVVLLQQMIPEDVALKNEIVRGGLSRDPFLQSRQDAAAEIRTLLIEYRLINPLDQQKNTTLTNPYAVYFDIVIEGDTLTARIDGNAVALSRTNYLDAIHAIRRNLYQGEAFTSFDTQVPWMTEEIAYPFRFIKQQIAAHAELSVMDALYMLERAVEPS